MQRIFGSARAPQPKATVADVITKTDARVDSVDGKIQKLDVELTKFKNQMAKMREGPAKDSIKQRALRLLKQKKLYESQRDQLAQQSFNLEQTNMTTENLQNTILMVDTMKISAKAMKAQYKKVNLSKVEDLHDELNDLMEDANEVQDVLSRTYGISEDIDESMLDAELEALGDDFLSSELEELSTSTMPQAGGISKTEELNFPDMTGLRDPSSSTPSNKVQEQPNSLNSLDIGPALKDL